MIQDFNPILLYEFLSNVCITFPVRQFRQFRVTIQNATWCKYETKTESTINNVLFHKMKLQENKI